MAPKKKSGEADLKEEVAKLKEKLAQKTDAHDKDGIALIRTMRERDAYKKAKEENDERFMRERDEALANVEALEIQVGASEETLRRVTIERDEARSLHAKMTVYAEQVDPMLLVARKDRDESEAKVAALSREVEALTKESDDAASRIVELQAMLQQKLSPSETCKEERAEGNGGCGACAICCKELKDTLEKNSAQAHAALDDLDMQWKDAKKEVFQFKADYEGACKIIADMHAAAVGEVRGPSVGPVEDVAALRSQYLEAKKAAQVVTGYDGVLKEIQDERARQDKKWGQQNHQDGTGHSAAKAQADNAKSICDYHAKNGTLTWMHILTEEMLEAFAETDEEKLRAELIQSAAVATAWAECIVRRQHGRKG